MLTISILDGNWIKTSLEGIVELVRERLARLDIIVHGVEEAVEGLELSLEPHQHQ